MIEMKNDKEMRNQIIKDQVKLIQKEINALIDRWQALEAKKGALLNRIEE